MKLITVTGILAFIFMGAIGATYIKPKVNGQSMEYMSPKFDNVLYEFQKEPELLKMIKIDTKLFSFILKYVQQKLRKFEPQEQVEHTLIRGTRE